MRSRRTACQIDRARDPRPQPDLEERSHRRPMDPKEVRSPTGNSAFPARRSAGADISAPIRRSRKRSRRLTPGRGGLTRGLEESGGRAGQIRRHATRTSIGSLEGRPIISRAFREQEGEPDLHHRATWVRVPALGIPKHLRDGAGCGRPAPAFDRPAPKLASVFHASPEGTGRESPGTAFSDGYEGGRPGPDEVEFAGRRSYSSPPPLRGALRLATPDSKAQERDLGWHVAAPKAARSILRDSNRPG